MSDLLSSEETRQSICHYFTKTPELRLRKTQIRYIVSVNGKRHFSNGQEISNNHEETDTLVFHSLEQMKPINCTAIAHTTDTDIYFYCLNTAR